MISSSKRLFATVILILMHPLYADVINDYIERIGSAAVKDINCQNYTITTGALLDVSAGGTLREVATFTNNGTWDYGTGRIIELGAWVNNGTVAAKPTQIEAIQNLEFTTLCGPISVLGTSDTDGDGISDADEGDNAVALGHGITLDQDGDGIYNFLDDDSDNDGVLDSVEGGNNKDENANGVPDYLDKVSLIPPTSTDDSQNNNVAGESTTIDVLANDSSVNPVDASTVSLDPASIDGSVGTDTDGDGDIDKVFVANEGTWTVDAVNGKITFTPVSGFTGDPTPIKYTVKDSEGLESEPATITLDYINALSAENDKVYANRDVPVTIDVLGNDSGDKPLNATSVLIIDPSNGVGNTVLFMAGEGTWNVDTSSGTITFTPEFEFLNDPTPIQYTVEDDEGTVSNKATVEIGYITVVELELTETTGICPATGTIDVFSDNPECGGENVNISIIDDAGQERGNSYVDYSGKKVTYQLLPGESKGTDYFLYKIEGGLCDGKITHVDVKIPEIIGTKVMTDKGSAYSILSLVLMGMSYISLGFYMTRREEERLGKR